MAVSVLYPSCLYTVRYARTAEAMTMTKDLDPRSDPFPSNLAAIRNHFWLSTVLVVQIYTMPSEFRVKESCLPWYVQGRPIQYT
jgi:hypothetical protein